MEWVQIPPKVYTDFPRVQHFVLIKHGKLTYKASVNSSQKYMCTVTTHRNATEGRSTHFLCDVLCDTQFVTVGEVLEVDPGCPGEGKQHTIFPELW